MVIIGFTELGDVGAATEVAVSLFEHGGRTEGDLGASKIEGRCEALERLGKRGRSGKTFRPLRDSLAATEG